MIIIGFTGPAGCGKDTAAMALVRQLGFTRMSFAAPIKEALNAMFGWDPGMWLDREWKERYLDGFRESPRTLAQTLGTEWARALDPDFWVKVMDHRIDLGPVKLERVVISDVRFPNEATWIRSHGGHVINASRDLDTVVAEHSSEAGLSWDLIDFQLANSGGVKQLEKETVELVRDILSS